MRLIFRPWLLSLLTLFLVTLIIQRRRNEGVQYQALQASFKLKMADVISASSAMIALCSLGYTLYQARAADQGKIIQASIDVSKLYLKDREDIDGLLEEFNTGHRTASDIKRVLSKLEYVAYLSNRGLIDRRYLSVEVLCEIKNAQDSKKRLLAFAHGFHEIDEFVKGIDSTYESQPCSKK